ncbi:hypothetical protein [Motiliproteus sediminis]|uniref:hypothetical protein n=1 Tax=Motiliproteus sediminis TaxID=1468178 RepID=UPI001AF00545|nr:hypothetical protein [Motiliproteus sediminis]
MRHYLIYLLLFLVVIAQLLNGVYALEITITNYALYARAAIFCLLIFLCLCFKDAVWVVMLFLLALSASLVNFIISDAEDVHKLLGNLYFISKIIYPICFLGVSAYIHRFLGINDKIHGMRFLNAYVWALPLLSIIALVFVVESARTYDASYRFGYKGVIATQNEVAITFLFLVMYAVSLKQPIQKSVLFFLCLVGLVVSGTKAAAGVFVLSGLLFVWKSFYNKFFLSCLILLIPLSMFVFADEIYLTLSNMIDYTVHQQERTNSLFSALVSGRDIQLMEVLSSTDVGLYQALLVGGVVSYDLTTELDFFDLVLFCGVPFSLLYLFVMSKFAVELRHFQYKIFFFSILIVLMSFGGHVIYAVSSFEILFVLTVLLYEKNFKESAAFS